MGKKILNIVIFLILGYILNYIATIAEVLISGRVMGGPSGFPFQYGSSSFLGSQTFNNYIYSIDIIFWTAIVFFGWKLLGKSRKKK